MAQTSPAAEQLRTASWARRILALFVDWTACNAGRGRGDGADRLVETAAPTGLYTMGLFILESTVLTALSGGSFGKLATRLRVSAPTAAGGRSTCCARCCGSCWSAWSCRRWSSSPTGAACTTWPPALSPFRSAAEGCRVRLRSSCSSISGGLHAHASSHRPTADRRTGGAHAGCHAGGLRRQRTRCRRGPCLRGVRQHHDRVLGRGRQESPVVIDDGGQISPEVLVEKVRNGVENTQYAHLKFVTGSAAEAVEGEGDVDYTSTPPTCS